MVRHPMQPRVRCMPKGPFNQAQYSAIRPCLIWTSATTTCIAIFCSRDPEFERKNGFSLGPRDLVTYELADLPVRARNRIFWIS